MRQLSQRVRELLDEVKNHPGILGRFLRSHDTRREHFDEIASSKELAAIPYLMHLWLTSPELGRDSLRAISQLLASASPEELLELDDEIRWTWDYVFPEVLRRVQPSGVTNLVKDIEFRTAALGILSWHPNGHVRQRAVQELDLLPDGSEIPYLLIRINDWVEAVRRDARRSIMTRLDRHRAATFFDHLYLVFRLADCHRDDHSEIITRVIRQLTSPTSEAKLSAALNSHSRSVRRNCYRLAMANEGPHRSVIVRTCLQSEDPALRCWASRDARQALSLDELDGAVQAMLQDSFMPVRREGLLTLIERFTVRAPLALKEALLESAVSMREFARFHLQKLEPMDTIAFYREAVKEGRRLSSAIAGLGEVGTSADADLLRPFLQADSARVRAASTRSIGALAAEQNVQALLQMLQDDSRRVSREAQKALQSRLEHVSISGLWNMFQTDMRPHVRWAVLGLFQEFDTWSAMPYLLEAAGDSDLEMAEHVRGSILRRMNRVFTKPTLHQRRAIDERLDLIEARLGAFVDECRRWLASRCS